jgi:hypothetical protein
VAAAVRATATDILASASAIPGKQWLMPSIIFKLNELGIDWVRLDLTNYGRLDKDISTKAFQGNSPFIQWINEHHRNIQDKRNWNFYLLSNFYY